MLVSINASVTQRFIIFSSLRYTMDWWWFIWSRTSMIIVNFGVLFKLCREHCTSFHELLFLLAGYMPTHTHRHVRKIIHTNICGCTYGWMSVALEIFKVPATWRKIQYSPSVSKYVHTYVCIHLFTYTPTYVCIIIITAFWVNFCWFSLQPLCGSSVSTRNCFITKLLVTF